MKVRDAIDQVRELKPNQYSDETMMRWLSDMDGQIWQDLLCHYGPANAPAPEPYQGDTGMKQELLVGFPHEEIYVTWLGAKIDYQNREFESYNNAMMMFNAQRQAFFDAWNRTHMARQDACIGPI